VQKNRDSGQALSIPNETTCASKNEKSVMKISEVNIQLIKPTNGLIAFASVVLDDKVYLGSIGVHQRLDGTGYRLTYPTKKTGNRDFHIFHPIEKNLGQQIERAILTKVVALLEKQHAGGTPDLRGGGDAIG